jgi:hypothetical protein
MKRIIRELVVDDSFQSTSSCCSEKEEAGRKIPPAVVVADACPPPLVAERTAVSSSSSSLDNRENTSRAPLLESCSSVELRDDATTRSIDFQQQVQTATIVIEQESDEETNSIVSSACNTPRRVAAAEQIDKNQEQLIPAREEYQQQAVPARAATPRMPSQQAPDLVPFSEQLKTPRPMTATCSLQHASGLLRQQRSAVSVHRAWTLERVAAEERRQEAELARQWQDLTFQPQLRQIHCFKDPVTIEHSIPCHERLYKATIHPMPPGYRPPPEPVLLEKPVISENSKRLANRRGPVHDRLLPPKPVEQKPPKIKKAPDGLPQAVERLSKPIERRTRCRIEEPTFRPNISIHHSSALLQSKKPVVDRLYTNKTRVVQ